MWSFYLALTFWLMIGLLEAYGIFKLWEGLVRPRWIHVVLLPGTVVAETAHFLAALLSGAPIREAKLLADTPVGQGGEPGPVGQGRQGIPVLGPLLLALLPILAGLAVIYALYRNFDSSVVDRFTASNRPLLAQQLNWQLAAWFALARELLTLVERLVESLPLSKPQANWQSWLFIYLTACLAVRMVPLRHNLRSGMAAIILVGLMAAGLGFIDRVNQGIHQSWSLISYVIALLTTLLILSLLVRGLVALALALASKGKPSAKHSPL